MSCHVISYHVRLDRHGRKNTEDELESEVDHNSCSCHTFSGAARTTARLDGEEWVLDGTKAWITNAHDAQSSIVFATTDSSKKHKWVNRLETARPAAETVVVNVIGLGLGGVVGVVVVVGVIGRNGAGRECPARPTGRSRRSVMAAVLEVQAQRSLPPACSRHVALRRRWRKDGHFCLGGSAFKPNPTMQPCFVSHSLWNAM